MHSVLIHAVAPASGATDAAFINQSGQGTGECRSGYPEQVGQVVQGIGKANVRFFLTTHQLQKMHGDLGDINGIPRVLDAGQCNDSYSLAVIALKLKEAFGFDDINELPISFDIAWYEQKAVAVLLALLSLGVKGIRLGPTLPAFLSPNVVKVLVENFDIKPTGDVQEDIQAIMQGA